jgi:uncharacterized coiled-coil protein SlyX
MSAEMERIESKIAYLEQASAELSDELYRQSQLIEALKAKLDSLSDQLTAAQSDTAARTPEQERPPHY